MVRTVPDVSTGDGRIIRDSDENMGLAQEYRIVSIPAVIVLKDGVEVARTVGFQPKDAMRSFIEEHLN